MMSNKGMMRALTMKHKRQPRMFKAEDRVPVKKKRGLLAHKFYEVPKALELVKDIAGCVGQVNPGTVIRLTTTRTTAVGKMFFFDGFKRKSPTELEWIGEFDTMRLEDIASGVGRELEPTEFEKVTLPDETGVLREVVGSMIESEGVGDLRQHE